MKVQQIHAPVMTEALIEKLTNWVLVRSRLRKWVVLFVLLGIGPVQADWLNPTDRTHCFSFEALEAQIQAVRRNNSQCYGDAAGNYNLAGIGRYIQARCIYEPYETPIRTFAECTSGAQNECQLRNTLNQRKTTCLARYEAHQARKKALEAEQKELERLARENSVGARAGRRLNAAGQARYNQLASGPQNVVRDAQTVGIGIGLARNRIPSLSGASHLSSLMTEAGGQLLGHMWRDGISQLDSALDQFNASNPRPTAGQREQYYNERGELLYTFVTANTRAHATDPKLPLGTQSAVVGAYAGAITQIVEMRNSGEIDQPIATLGTVAATVLAVKAYREAEARVEMERVAKAAKDSSLSSVTAHRQALAAQLRSQRSKRAPRPKTLTPNPKPTSPRRRADHCIFVYERGFNGAGLSYQLVRNTCHPQQIVCNNSLSNPNPKFIILNRSTYGYTDASFKLGNCYFRK